VPVLLLRSMAKIELPQAVHAVKMVSNTSSMIGSACHAVVAT